MIFEAGEKAFGHNFVLNDGLTCSECKTSNAPDAPEVIEITYSSVTLSEKDYLEYSIDGINWQSSSKFEGLEPETEYTFYCRVAQSEIADVSEMSEAVTVTTAIKYDNGDINGDFVIDSADLRLLKLLVGELISVDDPEIKNVEVDNESGEPDASDLRVLKLMIAGLPY